jgi:hypothetical protein
MVHLRVNPDSFNTPDCPREYFFDSMWQWFSILIPTDFSRVRKVYKSFQVLYHVQKLADEAINMWMGVRFPTYKEEWLCGKF